MLPPASARASSAPLSCPPASRRAQTAAAQSQPIMLTPPHASRTCRRLLPAASARASSAAPLSPSFTPPSARRRSRTGFGRITTDAAGCPLSPPPPAAAPLSLPLSLPLPPPLPRGARSAGSRAPRSCASGRQQRHVSAVLAERSRSVTDAAAGLAARSAASSATDTSVSRLPVERVVCVHICVVAKCCSPTIEPLLLAVQSQQQYMHCIIIVKTLTG